MAFLPIRASPLTLSEALKIRQLPMGSNRLILQGGYNGSGSPAIRDIFSAVGFRIFFQNRSAGMDTKMLEAFVRLYEKRSLRQAAEQLYISPQGLSRLLQNLEIELDVILFTRTPRGMEPTAAGEYLYQQAGALLRQHRQLTQSLQRIGGRETDLSFVCSYGVLNALPYALLQEFQAENPSFTIK